MDKVTGISEAKSIREKNSEKKMYEAKAKEIEKYKQAAIESLFKRLQNTELDDKTILLLKDFNDVMWSLWDAGRLKREYAGETSSKLFLKNSEKRKSTKPKRRA